MANATLGILLSADTAQATQGLAKFSASLATTGQAVSQLEKQVAAFGGGVQKFTPAISSFETQIGSTAAKAPAAAGGINKLAVSVAAFGGGVKKASIDCNTFNKDLSLVSLKTPVAAAAIHKLFSATQNASKALSSARPGINQASNALLNLGRVAQDAPFGIIGIANNLNPLLESFQRTRKEAGSFGATMKALGASLLGGGGLGLALSIGTGLLSAFALSNRGSADAVEKNTGAVTLLKKWTEEASEKQKEFQQAVDKAAQSVLGQADKLKDLQKLLISTSASMADLTQKTINQATAQFLFDKKNEALQKVITGQIEKQLKARRASADYIDFTSPGPKDFNPFEQRTPFRLDETTKKIKEGTAAYNDLNNQIKGSDQLKLADLSTFFKDFIFKGKEAKKDAKTFLELAKEIATEFPDLAPPPIFESFLLSPADSEKIAKQYVEEFKKALEEGFKRSNTGVSPIAIEPIKVPVEPEIIPRATEQQLKGLSGLFKGFEVPIKLKPVLDKKEIDRMARAFEFAKVAANAASNAFGSAFDALANGENVIKSIANALKQLVLDLIKATIQALLLKAISNLLLPGAAGAGGGGALSGLLSGFGGFRASGGPVSSRTPYVVGENGPEVFVPKSAGTIIPNSNSATSLQGVSTGGFAGGQIVSRVSGRDILLVAARQGRYNKSFV